MGAPATDGSTGRVSVRPSVTPGKCLINYKQLRQNTKYFTRGERKKIRKNRSFKVRYPRKIDCIKRGVMLDQVKDEYFIMGEKCHTEGSSHVS